MSARPLPDETDENTATAGTAVEPITEDVNVDARAAICTLLTRSFTERGNRFMTPKDALFMHGALYDGPRQKPTVLWQSDKKPRKDHEADDWLTATEYEDKDVVMAAKVAQL